MSFKTEIKAIVKKYLDQINQIDADIEKICSETGMYSGNYIQMKKEELGVKRSNAMLDCKREVSDRVTEFRNSLPAKYAMNGEELTKDADVLKFCNGNDLNLMFDRYEGNNTMQRIIADYALSNGVEDFDRYYTAIDDDKTLADDMERYARNMMANPYLEDEINDMFFGAGEQ